MLHPEVEAFANRYIMNLAAASAALAVLAGCAIAVPLRPLAMSSHDSRACPPDPHCAKASTDPRVVFRRSQPVRGSKIEDDPPDFIANNGGDQDSKLR